MNIKNVSISSVIPLDPKPRVDGSVRTQGSTDRDANGRRDQKEEEQKRHLSEQEFDDALKILTAHPGLKANDLIIKVEVQDATRVILIVDPEGKVVRRLSESQLWSATRDKDRQTGRILDKAM